MPWKPFVLSCAPLYFDLDKEEFLYNNLLNVYESLIFNFHFWLKPVAQVRIYTSKLLMDFYERDR